MKKFQLYVWEDVFCDWNCGMAVAVARSKEEAIQIVAERYSPDRRMDDIVREELAAEPKVYPLNEPIGFYSTGGG